MAALDLEEQEQLSELKTWWRMYGHLVTGGVAAVALSVAGWLIWGSYQRGQTAQAAAVYQSVQNAAAAHDARKAREAAGELIEKFPGTAYAVLGALTSARQQFDAGDLKTAKAQLQWVTEKARDAEMRDLARLRLAHVLFDEKAFEDALKLLTEEPIAALAPRFADLRGDILAVQDKKAEARAAYQAALAKLDAAQKEAGAQGGRDSGYRNSLQIKADALGDK